MCKYSEKLKLDIKKVKLLNQINSIGRSRNINAKYYGLKLDIINSTNFLPPNTSIGERIYYIINNITKVKVCLCGCNTPIKNFKCNYINGHSNRDKKVKYKKEQTCLRKYGVSNPSKIEEVKIKKEQTCLKNYGVKSPYQNLDIKNKTQNTCLEIYGSKSALGNSNVRDKSKDTSMKRYGTKIPSQSNIVKDKIKLTNLEKYGSVSPMGNKDIQEKSKQTCLKHYGVEYSTQNNTISEKIKKKLFNNFYSTLLNNRLKHKFKPLFTLDEYNGSKLEYEFLCIECNNIVTAKIINGRFPRCLNCDPYTISQSEQEIKYFIEERVTIENNNRNIIKPLELDIYIPSKKIAIEFNGNYWHSELNGKDKNYHLNKTKLCEKQGIQLIHIFEDEWIYKQQIVKSRLKHILDMSKYKIYGRKCEIKIIDNKTKNRFLDKYHIQGQDRSSIRLGAYYKDRLVAVMTFGKRRFDKQDGNELMRFCSVGNFNVIGIAGKLLKHFERNYKPVSIISYADRRWSVGNLYKQLGFKMDHISSPNFFYISGNCYNRENRLKYQKHKLSNILENFDNNFTAIKNMQMNGYDRIFDCGNYVFVKYY